MVAEEIRVEPLAPGEEGAWLRFLEHSDNGTLFHDLRFLAYHPPQRFERCDLLVRQGDKVLALLPAGLQKSGSEQLLVSPCGASVGEPVLAPGTSVRRALAVIEALQAWTVEQDLDGIQLTLGPPIYHRQLAEQLSYVLPACGFEPTERWLGHAIDLRRKTAEELSASYSKTRRYEIRRQRAAGLEAREVSQERLDELYEILLDNQARLGSTPTHSRVELADLMQRLPGRVRLFLCSSDGIEIAGVVVFVLNSTSAYTFYICDRGEHRQQLGPSVLVAHVAEVLAEERLHWLDLGPSSFDDYRLNAGVAFFKEGFGALGWCRRRWLWRRTGQPASRS